MGILAERGGANAVLVASGGQLERIRHTNTIITQNLIQKDVHAVSSRAVETPYGLVEVRYRQLHCSQGQ